MHFLWPNVHTLTVYHCWVSGVKKYDVSTTSWIATHCQPRRQQKQDSCQSSYRCLTAWDASRNSWPVRYRTLGMQPEWPTGAPRTPSRMRGVLLAPIEIFVVELAHPMVSSEGRKCGQNHSSHRRLATRNDWTRSHRPLTEILAE